jgi:hypothetical protein
MKKRDRLEWTTEASCDGVSTDFLFLQNPFRAGFLTV